jgi:DNA-binding transcriptional LysR family regulator
VNAVEIYPKDDSTDAVTIHECFHRLLNLMLNFSLEQLNTLLTVWRVGGISRAAKSLSVTQPAITTRLKNLESTLGVRLFEKGNSSLKLTRAGEQLLHYAQQIEAICHSIETNIADPETVEGVIRIGASETVAQTWLPDFISALHEHLPKIQIEYHVDVSTHLRAAILDREIDLGFLLGPIDDARAINVPLPEFELEWYASAEQDLSADPETFFSKPVLTYAKGTRPFFEIKDAVKTIGSGNVQVFPSSSLYGILRMVEQGLGVAAIPKALGESWVSSRKLKKFERSWTPSPLAFTASFLRDASNPRLKQVSQLALKVALAFHTNDKNN